MKNLRILIIRNANFSRGPRILPNSLKVLDWSGYQSSSIPFIFNPKNLAILNLPKSFLKRFESLKVFEKLNFLDFEGCKFLTEIRSLSRVPNLGALCLDYCTNLFQIDESIGFLDKLVLLSAQGCTQLESLVPYINLPSLETLDLRGCSRLERFPEVLGVMENIKDVHLDQTALEQIPFTIGNLVGLQRLFLRGCQGMIQLPNYILPKLEIITTYGCRGFRSSKDEGKVSPKVFTNAMCVYYEYGKSFLNVYSLNISSNIVIEVCSLPWTQLVNELKKLRFDLSFNSNIQVRVFAGKLCSNESLVCFWFRKKFPRIALWCILEPKKHFDNNMVLKHFDNNMVLDVKFNVVINGTKQLSTSCEYIFYTRKMTDQILSCDLQCKSEVIFSEKEWNHVEILCEIEYLMPCDSKRVMTYHDRTTKRILKWSVIYVYPENNKDDFSFINNPDFPLSPEQKFQEQRRIRYMYSTFNKFE
ncbi:probable disease resistance protein RPP1 [Medicago truncatula]|nr:probable disease resistance protein RPP1 [Medicago truncatula]XP_039688782.1 probable disease resistance protein RPP1 [Medicago truncatula]